MSRPHPHPYNELDRLTEIARERYDTARDPSHDQLHLLRVKKTCESLGKRLGARMQLLLPAALLHDIIHVPKDSPDRAKASAMAADEARKLLSGHRYSQEDAAEIAQIILEHSFSAGLKPTSLESAILQDADRLDAIGAIGVARLFTTACKLGSRYYDSGDPFAERRPRDDKKFALDHFYTKLLKLPELMNTEPARQEAERRSRYMLEFLEQFQREIVFE